MTSTIKYVVACGVALFFVIFLSQNALAQQGGTQAYCNGGWLPPGVACNGQQVPQNIQQQGAPQCPPGSVYTTERGRPECRSGSQQQQYPQQGIPQCPPGSVYTTERGRPECRHNNTVAPQQNIQQHGIPQCPPGSVLTTERGRPECRHGNSVQQGYYVPPPERRPRPHYQHRERLEIDLGGFSIEYRR